MNWEKRRCKGITKRGNTFGKKLKEHWDEENGIYRDIYTQTGECSEHLAPTNFYPLLTKIPDKKLAKRMIEERFFNENEFPSLPWLAKL